MRDAIGRSEGDFYWEKVFTHKDIEMSGQMYKETLMEKRRKLDSSSMY